MEENVKNQLDQLGNIIDAKLEKAHGQAVDSATGKADVALKGEIANLTQKFTERMDAIEVSNKKRFEASKRVGLDLDIYGGGLKDGKYNSN